MRLEKTEKKYRYLLILLGICITVFILSSTIIERDQKKAENFLSPYADIYLLGEDGEEKRVWMWCSDLYYASPLLRFQHKGEAKALTLPGPYHIVFWIEKPD